VWDLAGEDQILKLETKALGGRINDLDWDMESKRIVVGGDGRDRFAAAFTFWQQVWLWEKRPCLLL
jgi:hypothetical protein